MSRRILLAAAAACGALLWSAAAWADGAPAPAPESPATGGAAVGLHKVTGLKLWPSPTGTRVAIEFSSVVAHVAPDSGAARQVIVTVPEATSRAAGVPEVLRVGDGLVDSVLVITGDQGSRFVVWLRDATKFRVYDVPPQEDRPFGIVIEVTRPGAAVAEGQRLENIATEKRKDKVRVVAVDAGHGGDDTGARAPRSVGVLEKNVTLAVARALVGELNKIPGVKGVLTRGGDYFVPLQDRYHMAEKMKADLFISIHANSNRRRNSAGGTEVYFLSLGGASAQAEKDLADAENAADLVGGVPPQTGDELVNILYDVKRSSVLQQSQLLAETVLDNIAATRRLESRGVKQAGFVVLKSVEFPSILVETAFINNVAEARLLKNPTFQASMAKQIAEGVKEYFRRARIGLGDSTGSGAAPGG
jgi:N-acetylmuramoyl-L-alanine amidase